MKSVRLAAGLSLALLLCSSLAHAQLTESRLLGRVVDSSGAILPGVTVTVTSARTGAQRTTVSSDDGTFTVTNLENGSYLVAFELSGFAGVERAVTLGVGEQKPVQVTLALAGVTEEVTVSAETATIDLTGARIGVNVSPDEVRELPVNGRNFANLMTLATGATSDGNGGWASVRFNGKSNQQNYLNYDGVDGTYVWDASPGYLNATGSQFRLQTSMESVAEFRVNSGLAPAESGLGAGGNITVVTKSGGNAFRGSVFEYKRDDALDSASKYDDKKQPLDARPVRRVHRRSAREEPDVLLRQLRGADAEDRPERSPKPCRATRRVGESRPASRWAAAHGQSPDRTRAVAPLLSGFPQGTAADGQPARRARDEHDQRESGREHHVAARSTSASATTSRSTCGISTATGDLDTPDRTVTPRRVRAKQQPQNVVGNFQSIFGTAWSTSSRSGYNSPQTSATCLRPAGLRPDGRLAVGHVHLVVHRRPRHDGHRAQRAADSRDQRLVDDRLGLRAAVAVVRQRDDVDARARTP